MLHILKRVKAESVKEHRKESIKGNHSGGQERQNRSLIEPSAPCEQLINFAAFCVVGALGSCGSAERVLPVRLSI